MTIHEFPKKTLVLIAALGLVAACSPQEDKTAATAQLDSNFDTLVTAEWLSEHIDDPDLVVLDCSVLIQPDEDGNYQSVSGRPNFENGHIQGAAFADLKGDLSDSSSPHQFAVPSPERFAEVMGELGVGDKTRVVLYDNSNSAWAARVWWMLRWVGFDRAALLDGGLDAWTDAGQSLSTGSAMPTARILTPAVRPELIADRDEVFAAIDKDDVNIIDALPAPQYSGEMTMYARPGHISSASNVPINSLVDDSGQYLPGDELGTLFEGDKDTRAITYCGGGIAASSNAFIMTRLGYKDVAVYTASLQEWAADPANPMTTGTDP
jgi:thiosulfate/3-mercaptopyruvate sulfurtransferase